MIEGFKLTAEKIKRVIKLAVHLPDDYYTNNKQYPLLLVFDGGLFFSFLNEDNKEIDLKSILDNLNKDMIVIGLFAPRINEWNISELNPYYSGTNDNVDISYSSIFFDYITNDFIPLLKQKYRFNDNISLMGIETGGAAVISMLSRYNIYKNGIILSLNMPFINDLIIDDANKIKNKNIYNYNGEKDLDIESINRFLEIEKALSNDNNLILDYEKDDDNSINSIVNNIIKGLEII